MYQAIFCLAYYRLMRKAELTKSVSSCADHSIKNENIHIGQNKDKILITLYSSKMHDQSSYPQQIKISSLLEEKKSLRSKTLKGGRKHTFFCPFEVVRNYIDFKHYG